jgi:hypothetical protein
LIAHELAHVVQQQGASAPPGRPAPLAAESSALEEDADRSAAGAVVGLWGRAKGTAAAAVGNILPALRSGLRLQRCSKKTEIDPTQQAMGDRVTKGMAAINTRPSPDSGLYYWPKYKSLCDADTTGKFKWQEDYRTGYTTSPYFKKTGDFKWTLNEGASASAAIQSWLKGLTVADCASAAAAIEYDTIRAAVGDKTFDAYFSSAGKKKQWLVISQYPSEIPLKEFLYDVEKDDLQPGDWYYWKNHPDYKYKHPRGLWQGENAVYLGKDPPDAGATAGQRRWSGFGASSKTDEEMLQELLKQYNKERSSFDLQRLEEIKQENQGQLPPEYLFTNQGGRLKEDLGTDPLVIVNAGGGLQQSGWRLSPLRVRALREQ